MYTKSILACAALITGISGCGGGAPGGPNIPDPVIANGPPPGGIAGLVGLEFPLRLATLRLENAGTTVTTGRETYGLTFTSPTTATLVTPEGTVMLAEAAGQFEGTLNGRDFSVELGSLGLDYVAIFEVTEAQAPDAQQSLGVLGLETPQTQMDNLQMLGGGIATYTGNSQLITLVGALPSVDDGTTTLGVNFGTGAVIGDVFAGAGGTTLSIAGGQIQGNGFTGTLVISGAPGATITSSDLDGIFYSPDASEMAGTFEGAGDISGDDLSFSGVFIAENP